jgi:DNA-binding HxlR family transcriptional regulator
MHQYGQYCPIAQALEIIGDRWTLLIIRDLLTGTRHFNDLERGLPGISRGLLADRLRRLQQMGIVEKHEISKGRKTTEYLLTQAGKELQAVMDSLLDWGAAWAFDDPRPDELDPVLLMWWMRRRVCTEQLPEERVVVQFDFFHQKLESYWLVMDAEDVSVCLTYPGFEIDVLVTADLAAYYQLWLGRISYEEALTQYDVRVDGLPALVRDFPNWFAWSPAATTVRAVQARFR